MSKTILSIAAFVCTMLLSCSKELQVYESGNLVPKTVVEDPALPSITVNNAKLHAQAFGPVDSTLIICLHGGPGANFRYMLNCISLASKGYRVVFYDQRGSGLSERFSNRWYKSFGENAIDKAFYDDLKGVIAHYKTQPSQKFILLGHSWGAMFATGYAAKHPNEINGLITAEPGGLKWQDISDYINNSKPLRIWSEALNDVTSLDQFITGKENEHAILDYKLLLMSASGTGAGDTKSNLGANDSYYKTSRDGAVINIAMIEFGKKYKPDLSAGISQFQKKVLFIYSSNNAAYPDSWAQKISSVFPKKDIFKVQGVGHSGMLDQIDIWATVTEPKILQYIRSL